MSKITYSSLAIICIALSIASLVMFMVFSHSNWLLQKDALVLLISVVLFGLSQCCALLMHYRGDRPVFRMKLRWLLSESDR